MSVVRAFAWLLVATSVGAVLFTVSWVGRHLDVDPDLGPERVVTVPVRSGTDPAREPGPSDSPGVSPSDPPTRSPGARTDPAKPLPGGDTDDNGDPDRDDGPDTDSTDSNDDDDVDAPDGEPDDPADDN